MNPSARHDQVLAQPVGDELVVYDERTHTAHHLNPTAAAVWRLADGQRSVADIAQALSSSLAADADGDVVELALDELRKANLLAVPLPEIGEAISRRRMLALTAALVPVIASIEAAHAQTVCSPTQYPCACTTARGTYAGTATITNTTSCEAPTSATGTMTLDCVSGGAVVTIVAGTRLTEYAGATYGPTGAVARSAQAGVHCGVSTVGTISGTPVIYSGLTSLQYSLTETITYAGCTGSVTYNWTFTKSGTGTTPPAPTACPSSSSSSSSSGAPVTCAEIAGSDGSYFGTATRVSAATGCPSAATVNISVNVQCSSLITINVFELATGDPLLDRFGIYTGMLNSDGTFALTSSVAGPPGGSASGCAIVNGTLVGQFTRGTPNRLTFRETLTYAGCCTGNVVYDHIVNKA